MSLRSIYRSNAIECILRRWIGDWPLLVKSSYILGISSILSPNDATNVAHGPLHLHMIPYEALLTGQIAASIHI